MGWFVFCLGFFLFVGFFVTATAIFTGKSCTVHAGSSRYSFNAFKEILSQEVAFLIFSVGWGLAKNIQGILSPRFKNIITSKQFDTN